MDLILNFGFAWIAVIFAIILSIIFITRLACGKFNKNKKFFINLNILLRKYHKHIGILIVVVGLIHGLFSSESVFSFNLGTICLILALLLGVNWAIRKFLNKSRGWMFYHRILTIIFLVSIVVHVVDVGGIQVHKVIYASIKSESTVNKNVALENNSNIDNITSLDISDSLDNTEISDGSDSSVNAAPSASSGTSATSDSSVSIKTLFGQFKDGTYEGEAQAYGPGLKVSVVIKNNAIISIEVTEHNEVNQRFYAYPIEVVPQEIIESQSTEVDAVSGATFTSIGIMNAVLNALQKALISGELPSLQELPQHMGHGRH